MLKPIVIVTLILYTSVYAQNLCKPVNFGRGSVVCECNSTYCDFYPDPEALNKGEFVQYVSSKAGQRLDRVDGKISSKANSSYIIQINSNKRYQTMEGFGGAFTDSAGINILKLSKGAQENLMRSYFTTDGSKYNLGRVPIAGTDFSTRAYTYADTPGDEKLKTFALAGEDIIYKIPLMKLAQELNPSLRFIAAAWTAPPWMKNNKKYNKLGWLLPEYYQTYADYIIRFLEEYKNHGFEMWMVSTGNEPLTSLIPIAQNINTMLWTPWSASKWVINNLGPTLQKSNSNSTSILMVDDQRIALPAYAGLLSTFAKGALKYVKGLGVHAYLDEYVSDAFLDVTHALLPKQFIICTEFSAVIPWEPTKVDLGSWSRAERLIIKLIQNMNHWVVGWIDWNLALDTQGGPNWVENYIDASIIVNPKKDIFYKQPLFYALALSKFVPRSSIKIDVNTPDDSILSTGFITKNNDVVVICITRGKRR